MSEKRKLHRRGVLRRSAGAGLAAPGAPAVARARGANDRIHVAVIGCGARGAELIQLVRDEGKQANAAVRAVCDAYEPRLQAALLAAKAKGSIHYRAVLDQADIDAVVIATPDHWHGAMVAEALKAGKAVYVEPPLALRRQDARQVAELAKQKGLVVQVGATSCADTRWRQIHGHVAKGAIGPFTWSQACYAANSRTSPWNRPIKRGFEPRKLNWKAFLGAAPARRLDAERFFRWRKFWDYSNGLASLELHELLAHLLIAVGPRMPARVSAAGSGKVFPDQEPPDNLHVVLQYPNEHTVVLSATTACSEGVPEIIRGYEGTVHITASGARILCQPIHKGKHPAEVKIKGAAERTLMADFLHCIRHGGTPACGPGVAYPAAVAMDLAVQAYRTGEMVHLDGKPAKT